MSASFVAQIRPLHSLPIDVHLMVEVPVSVYTGAVRRRRRRLLTASETICREAFRVINMLRQAGKEVEWCSIPPHRLRASSTHLHLLDKVTVMTVDPGRRSAVYS
ncbi:hypothetical protein LNP74_32185 [Klebsiella pneumoniae subsp. pneumoniae]|nr:hypothetical protein [Klebsiella pneumoniae subsp. pneumoniae]